MKCKHFLIMAVAFGLLLVCRPGLADGGFGAATDSGERAVEAAEQAALVNDEADSAGPDKLIELDGPKSDPQDVVNTVGE